MKFARRITIIVLTIVLLCSSFSVCAFAEVIEAYPQKDPAPEIVAEVINHEIDKIYDIPGAQRKLYFEYSNRNYGKLEYFAEYMQPTVNRLNALFASKMVGEDYITTRCSFHSRTNSEGKKYYLGITVTVEEDAELRSRMDDIISMVDDMTPREQVDFLYDYLRRHIQYNAAYSDISGTYCALIYGKGVCMGYTRSMTELCRRLDIPCFNLINDDHMWNCVYLNGKWWMIDLTQNIYLTDIIRNTGNHEYDSEIYIWAKNYYAGRTRWNGTIKAAYMTDVNAGWYTEAVIECLGRDLFNGTSSHTFSPNDNMTRGMFVTVLGRLYGINGNNNTTTKFADVKKGQWYTGYVKWAADAGIVSGVSPKYFAPNDNVTREQICKMMVEYCNYAKIMLKNINEPVTFTDASKISKWAKIYIKQCQTAGLVGGSVRGGKTYFDPQGFATRAEVAQILYNFSKNYL